MNTTVYVLTVTEDNDTSVVGIYKSKESALKAMYSEAIDNYCVAPDHTFYPEQDSETYTSYYIDYNELAFTIQKSELED